MHLYFVRRKYEMVEKVILLPPLLCSEWNSISNAKGFSNNIYLSSFLNQIFSRNLLTSRRLLWWFFSFFISFVSSNQLAHIIRVLWILIFVLKEATNGRTEIMLECDREPLLFDEFLVCMRLIDWFCLIDPICGASKIKSTLILFLLFTILLLSK